MEDNSQQNSGQPQPQPYPQPGSNPMPSQPQQTHQAQPQASPSTPGQVAQPQPQQYQQQEPVYAPSQQHGYQAPAPSGVNPMNSGSSDKPSNKGLSIASLVLGILAVVSSIPISFFSLIFAIPAMVTGAMALSRGKSGMAITGLVLAVLSIIFTVVIFALLFIVGVGELDKCTESAEYRLQNPEICKTVIID